MKSHEQGFAREEKGFPMPRRTTRKALLTEIAEQLTPKPGQGRKSETSLVAIEKRLLPSGERVFRVRPAQALSHLTEAQIHTACRVLWVAVRGYLEAEGWSVDRVRVITIKPGGSVELAFSKLVGITADVKIAEMLERHGSGARALRRWKRQTRPSPKTRLHPPSDEAMTASAITLAGSSMAQALPVLNTVSFEHLPEQDVATLDALFARGLTSQSQLHE